MDKLKINGSNWLSHFCGCCFASDNLFLLPTSILTFYLYAHLPHAKKEELETIHLSKEYTGVNLFASNTLNYYYQVHSSVLSVNQPLY